MTPFQREEQYLKLIGSIVTSNNLLEDLNKSYQKIISHSQ